MKRIMIFLSILFFSLAVCAKGSIDVSKNSIVLDENQTVEFEITGDNSAGLITIKSTDENIVMVDQDKVFVDTMLSDSNKFVIKVTGKKAGTAKVNVELEDITTYDEETLTGTKEIEITVNGANSSTNNSNNSNTTFFVIIVAILIVTIAFVIINAFKRRNNQ